MWFHLWHTNMSTPKTNTDLREILCPEEIMTLQQKCCSSLFAFVVKYFHFLDICDDSAQQQAEERVFLLMCKFPQLFCVVNYCNLPKEGKYWNNNKLSLVAKV